MQTILVVEDEPMIRAMTERRLTFEGYRVISAGDGTRAVALARSELPDLILMDMGLPVLNGWQATEQIKSRPETQAIPVIALTAYALPEEREKCFAAGCDDYESKPIDFPRLIQKIRAQLPSLSPS